MQLRTDLALEQKEMLEEDRRTPEGVESEDVYKRQGDRLCRPYSAPPARSILRS